MKISKIVAMLVAFILLLGILAGCGAGTSKSSTTTPASTQAPQTITEVKKEPVKLSFSWWGSEERSTATLAAIDIWNKANPDIQVEGIPLSNEGYIDKLTTQLAGGNAPDLFNIGPQWLKGYADNNQLLDLTPYKDTYLQSINPTLWANYTNGADDRIWSIPFGQISDILAFNKTKFQQFGVTLPTNNETWDSWLDLVKQMAKDTNNDGKLDFWGFNYTWFFSPDGVANIYLNQMGYKDGMFTKDNKHSIFSDPKVIEAFKKFEAVRDYCPAPGVLQLKEGQSPVSAGFVAFGNCAYSNFPGIAKSSTDDIDCIAFPTLPGGLEVRRPSGGISFSINAASKYQEQALKFASFFVSDPDAGKALGSVRGVLPSKVQMEAYAASMGSDPDGVISQKVLNVANFISSLKPIPLYIATSPNAFQEWSTMFYEELQVYEYKKETLEQMYANIVKKGDVILAQ